MRVGPFGRYSDPMKPGLVVAAFCLLVPLSSAAAGGRDLHAYWDGRCKSCHGDAGDFARRTLAVERGRLVGTHHKDDLERFLRNHYLTDDLVAPVSAMLVAQVDTPPLFKQHCASCHGQASEFVRRSLSLRDGVLTGKASGRAVEQSLRAHGGLPAAQVPEMVKTLSRVLAEVGGPGGE